MSGVPPSPPPLPPRMPMATPYRPPHRPARSLSLLKAVGYFVAGTFWVVLNGTPVAPVGLLGLLGLLKERRKLATALLVLAGCVLGGIGTGISVRCTTDPSYIGFHVGVGLHPTFNRMILQRKFERIGLLDEGKALADTALAAMRAADVEAFRACFDPIAFSGPEEVKQFFGQFSETLGALGSFEYASAGTRWLPELRKQVYVLRYTVDTSKAGSVSVWIGLHKTSDGWKLLNINA